MYWPLKRTMLLKCWLLAPTWVLKTSTSRWNNTYIKRELMASNLYTYTLNILLYITQLSCFFFYDFRCWCKCHQSSPYLGKTLARSSCHCRYRASQWSFCYQLPSFGSKSRVEICGSHWRHPHRWTFHPRCIHQSNPGEKDNKHPI